jgi:hypothetical protein
MPQPLRHEIHFWAFNCLLAATDARQSSACMIDVAASWVRSILCHHKKPVIPCAYRTHERFGREPLRALLSLKPLMTQSVVWVLDAPDNPPAEK